MQYVAVSLQTEEVFFIQSANSDDMRDRIAQRIAAQQITANSALSSCELGGGGDGHTFVTRLGFTESDTANALASVTIRPYLASDDLNLPIARAYALQGLTGIKQDEPFAGASKGTRFMGLVVVGIRILLLP